MNSFKEFIKKKLFYFLRVDLYGKHIFVNISIAQSKNSCSSINFVNELLFFLIVLKNVRESCNMEKISLQIKLFCCEVVKCAISENLVNNNNYFILKQLCNIKLCLWGIKLE